MIITYYGNGKGKTTAALGLAVRASGYNKKILFIQFVKSEESKTGEDNALGKIKNLKAKKFGLGYVAIAGDKHPLSAHRKAARSGLEYVRRERANYEIIILDEILGAIKGWLLELDDVLELIKSNKPGQTLVLTGRPKYKEIIRLSDLVTEMKEIKHPFTKGKLAQKAIDY